MTKSRNGMLHSCKKITLYFYLQQFEQRMDTINKVFNLFKTVICSYVRFSFFLRMLQSCSIAIFLVYSVFQQKATKQIALCLPAH